MKVYVVTDTEAGWDDVCGVYEDFREAYESHGGKKPGGYRQQDCEDIHPYMIHEETFYARKDNSSNPYHIDYKRQTKLF